MPGTVISRSQPFVLTSQRFDLAGEALNARVQAAPVCRQVFEDTQHAGRERIGSRRKDARQLGPQETQPLPHRDAALQHEGADLIDDARALTDKPLAHPMQRLQVELVGRLGCDELHGWALHRLGDRFRIAVVVLLTFGIRAHAHTLPASGVRHDQVPLACD